MSDNNPNQELSPAAKDLERRQKGHKFMTTEEALAWNAERGLRPQSEKHWMAKERERKRLQNIEQGRLQRMRFLATGWKRLSKKQRADMRQFVSGLIG